MRVLALKEKRDLKVECGLLEEIEWSVYEDWARAWLLRT